MKKNILYTGADISLFDTNEDVLHFPLTKIIIKDGGSSQIANEFKYIYNFSHIVFTTKYAVLSFLHFLKVYNISYKMIEGIHVIATCSNCVHLLEKEKIYVTYVGSDETEAGLIRLLKTIDLKDAKILLPQSGMKKPALLHFLVEESINYKIVILYDLEKHYPYALVDLNKFTKIVFSSPLGVDVFFELFNDLPAHLQVRTMGLMTRCRLRKLWLATTCI